MGLTLSVRGRVLRRTGRPFLSAILSTQEVYALELELRSADGISSLDRLPGEAQRMVNKASVTGSARVKLAFDK